MKTNVWRFFPSIRETVNFLTFLKVDFRSLPLTENRLSFMQKYFLKSSKVSCRKCFWKFILIISVSLVLIFLIMTSLVSVFFWCFNKFQAFHISFSIIIWIVRRSFLTFLSLTRAFKISTQFVDVIFAALLSFVMKSKKCFHILYFSVHS